MQILFLDTKLGCEHAVLIGERVDSLASGCGRLLLELPIQANQNLELAILRDLGDNYLQVSCDDRLSRPGSSIKLSVQWQWTLLRQQSWHHCKPSLPPFNACIAGTCLKSEVKQRNNVRAETCGTNVEAEQLDYTTHTHSWKLQTENKQPLDIQSTNRITPQNHLLESNTPTRTRMHTASTARTPNKPGMSKTHQQICWINDRNTWHTHTYMLSKQWSNKNANNTTQQTKTRQPKQSPSHTCIPTNHKFLKIWTQMLGENGHTRLWWKILRSHARQKKTRQ